MQMLRATGDQMDQQEQDSTEKINKGQDNKDNEPNTLERSEAAGGENDEDEVTKVISVEEQQHQSQEQHHDEHNQPSSNLSVASQVLTTPPSTSGSAYTPLANTMASISLVHRRESVTMNNPQPQPQSSQSQSQSQPITSGISSLAAIAVSELAASSSEVHVSQVYAQQKDNNNIQSPSLPSSILHSSSVIAPIAPPIAPIESAQQPPQQLYQYQNQMTNQSSSSHTESAPHTPGSPPSSSIASSYNTTPDSHYQHNYGVQSRQQQPQPILPPPSQMIHGIGPSAHGKGQGGPPLPPQSTINPQPQHTQQYHVNPIQKQQSSSSNITLPSLHQLHHTASSSSLSTLSSISSISSPLSSSYHQSPQMNVYHQSGNLGTGQHQITGGYSSGIISSHPGGSYNTIPQQSLQQQQQQQSTSSHQHQQYQQQQHQHQQRNPYQSPSQQYHQQHHQQHVSSGNNNRPPSVPSQVQQQQSMQQQQQSTWNGGIESFYGYIRTAMDALLVVEGCRVGVLKALDERPRELSEIVIRSGSVVVFQEAESRMRRWR
ncbi:hypothetical protein HDU76_009819, partial [Blyttiomyces sp. JEL0837]